MYMTRQSRYMTSEEHWNPKQWPIHLQTLVNHVKENLDQNEHIVTVISGTTKSKTGPGLFSQPVTALSVMVCTNKRIIIHGKTESTEIYETCPLNQNITFNVETGILMSSIVICAANDTQQLDSCREENAHKFIEIANKQIQLCESSEI